MQKALVAVGAQPETTVIVAGIGCSGKIGNYVNSYNLHVTHGRTLPAAMGVKLANPKLTVLVAGGDGDAYAIGMGHFLHTIRRNPDVTYIVMDNHIYGLTKGQTSPTSARGFRTHTSPSGNIEQPVRPLMLALSAGATYIAQGFSSWQGQLAHLIEDAIRHPGFSLVNVLSPCVTYNKEDTYDLYKSSLFNLDEDATYQPGDRAAAFSRLVELDEMVTGVIFRGDSEPYHTKIPGFGGVPLAEQPLGLDDGIWREIVANL